MAPLKKGTYVIYLPAFAFAFVAWEVKPDDDTISDTGTFIDGSKPCWRAPARVRGRCNAQGRAEVGDGEARRGQVRLQ